MSRKIGLLIMLGCVVSLAGCGKQARVGDQKADFFDKTGLTDEFVKGNGNGEKESSVFVIDGVSGAAVRLNSDGTFCQEIPDATGTLITICSDPETGEFGQAEHQALCHALTDHGYTFPIQQGEVTYNISSKDGSGSVKTLLCVVTDSNGNPVTMPVGALVSAPGRPTQTFVTRPSPNNALSQASLTQMCQSSPGCILTGVSTAASVNKHDMDVPAINQNSFSDSSVLRAVILPSDSGTVVLTPVSALGDVKFIFDGLFPWKTTPNFSNIRGVEADYIVESNADGYGLAFLVDKSAFTGFILVLGEALLGDNLQNDQYPLKIRSFDSSGMGNVIQATNAQGSSVTAETTLSLTQTPPFYTLKVSVDNTDLTNIIVNVYFDSTLIWDLRMSSATSANDVGIFFADHDGMFPLPRIKDVSVYTAP